MAAFVGLLCVSADEFNRRAQSMAARREATSGFRFRFRFARDSGVRRRLSRRRSSGCDWPKQTRAANCVGFRVGATIDVFGRDYVVGARCLQQLHSTSSRARCLMAPRLTPMSTNGNSGANCWRGLGAGSERWLRAVERSDEASAVRSGLLPPGFRGFWASGLLSLRA